MNNPLGLVRQINMEDVVLKERAREDYGNIAELKLSIIKHGLIEPIVVYSPNNMPPFELLAGGRRHRACMELSFKTITARIYDHDLTTNERRAIELEENLRRKDLTALEQSKLTADFHTTMVNIRGPKISEDTGQSIRDTAAMLNVSVGKVHRDIQVAKIAAPLQAAGLNLSQMSQQQILNFQKRGQIAIKHQVMVENARKQQDMTDIDDTYVVGDFLNIEIEGSFDLIEVDPPYGIDYVKIATEGTKGIVDAEYKEVSPKHYQVFTECVVARCTSLAATDCYMIYWLSFGYFDIIKTTLQRFGWTVANVPAIWLKPDGVSPDYQGHLGSVYEAFFYCWRGNKKLTVPGTNNVFPFVREKSSDKIHPMEKPLPLVKKLIETFGQPGGTLLVPFAGSGVTLKAGLDYGMAVLGFDMSPVFREGYLAKYGIAK